MNYRFLKFIATGILNTLVGYSVYALGIYFNLDHQYALLVATVLGVVFNFITNKHWVFKDAQGNFLRFIGVYTIVYFFNLFILTLLLNYVTESAYFAQILSLTPTVLLTYLLLKTFCFHRKWEWKGKN